MAKYFIEDTTLTAMADKIRALTGTTGTLTPTQMTTEVQSAKEDVDSAMDALETLGITIPEGSDIGDLAGLVGEVESGTDTSDATAVASDIMLDKTAYGSDGKLTGTFTLDSEIGTQESLIATIKETLATKALPDSGGGGSDAGNGDLVASVDTCTVTINSFNSFYTCAYTAYENGDFVAKADLNSSSAKTIVLENVVCGSFIFFHNGYANNGVSHSHDSTMLYNRYPECCGFSAPTTAGVNATITVYDND